MENTELVAGLDGGAGARVGRFQMRSRLDTYNICMYVCVCMYIYIYTYTCTPTLEHLGMRLCSGLDVLIWSGRLGCFRLVLNLSDLQTVFRFRVKLEQPHRKQKVRSGAVAIWRRFLNTFLMLGSSLGCPYPVHGPRVFIPCFYLHAILRSPQGKGVQGGGIPKTLGVLGSLFKDSLMAIRR